MTWQRSGCGTSAQELEGWASRQAFTAASFPPGGWLHALNPTLDDLRVGNRSIARSSWASSSTFFVLQIGTLSQLQLASAAQKVSLFPGRTLLSLALASGVSTVSNLLSLPLFSLKWMTIRVLNHCIDKEIKTQGAVQAICSLRSHS